MNIIDREWPSWQHYTRVYDGRKLQVLGYNRQHIPGN
jgi:salicylate 5-hydroxylase large subunit